MPPVAVGIDVGLLNGKGLDLVALDSSCRIVESLRHIRDPDQIVRMVEKLAPDVVCIDSPSQWAEQGTRRPAELELARRGINLYATPSEDRVRPFHHWMRDGLTVYAALAHRYPRYTGGDVYGTAAEYFPHASAAALAGHIGPLSNKVQIRRQLLAQHEVDASALVGSDQVDAALGALTGLIALENRHTWVGEGTDAMLLPVQELPGRFSRVGAATSAGAAGTVPRALLPAEERHAPCVCGCGGMPAQRRSRFMPGHDHRVNPATGRRWNGLP